MASAGWNGGKAKSTAQAKAWMRHNSKNERIAANHSNTDIDKSRTPLNWSYRGLSYKARCAAYDKRMGEIDQGKPGSGKNARTVLQAVCVYSPAALRGDLDKLHDWFERVGQIAEAQFGSSNVIDMAVDVDEVHDYPDEDTGEQRTAAEHGHLWLVPEVDGRLNGKQFSRRAAITQFNDALQYMTEREFGCQFNDGTQAKRRGTVEQLKARSLKVEIEQLEARAETILSDAHDAARDTRKDARRYAQDTKREADQDRDQARRERNAAWVALDDAQTVREDADEYARTTRKAADQDADKTRQQAEQDAARIRQEAERDAERIRQEAAARAAAAQEAIRQRIRAEVDDAKRERDQAVTARRATRAALQGDLATWGELTPRPTAHKLLGVLGAAVRASRQQPPQSGVGSAWARMMAMVRAADARDNPGPTAVEGPTR